jgi:DNA-binding response OmpR family regulator
LRILIIEDSASIAANLYDFLEAHGHAVEVERDGMHGLKVAKVAHFDAILLDLGLPRLDGITLCRRLRGEACSDTPVLMITARDTLEDKLTGFESGADDYLVKPFALEEVEARLLALHKRHTGGVTSRALSVGKLCYDPAQSTLSYEGVTVPLPPKCHRLMEIFMGEPGRMFTRKELELELWGDEQETSDRLRTHMHLLRRTFQRACGRDPIVTVHGRGYRLPLES